MHCVIHKEMLASQKMSPELNILQDVIKIVNHLKVYALNSRLFMQLWEDMDAGHTHLLLYTEVKRHSKGGSLARASKLREPLQRFVLEKQSPLQHISVTQNGSQNLLVWHFQPAQWTLSVTLGRTTVFQLADKVAVLKAKLELSGDEWTLGFFTFQTLVEIVKETEPGPSFSQAMLSPMSAFKRVWPLLLNHNPNTGKEWIHNPFVNESGELTLSKLEKINCWRPQTTVVLKVCCCCEVASVVSDSVRPHRRQPTRLPRPWDSPGKNTGVGCHFLLQCMTVKSEREVAQSSDSSRPHGLQPTRLLCPWDSPGKSTGVGCHCLLP